MNSIRKQILVAYLESFLTEARREKFNRNLQNRMRHLTVVLENVYQSHNASAVLRSADCFGVQDVHIIENRNAYSINPDVALGSSKWLTIKHHNGTDFNTPAAYEALRESGYTIVATTPHTESCMLDDLPVEKPLALVFGTEKEGLSEWAISNADAWVKIPMYGFTESFNISVSAALCMYNLTERIRKSQVQWGLTHDEQLDIRLEWIRNTIDQCNLLEERFMKESAGTTI